MTAPPNQPSPPDRFGNALSQLIDDVRRFFRSPFNRFCFYGTCGLGFYLWHQRLQHGWRMAEMQRRIDANFLLKISQWFSQNLNGGVGSGGAGGGGWV